jgi:predicted dehydrogenase
MPTGVALIGAGMVAPTYLDAIGGLPDVELRGVLARRPESAQRLLERHACGSRVYRTIGEVAADDSVLIAIVCTPPDQRRDVVMTLSDAGKHILMEKPVERTFAAAEELCDICDAAAVTLGITLQHRAKVVVADLHELIDTGELGPPVAAEIAVPWWRPQSYYDESGRGTYDRDGGGVLISQAIHTLDLALSLTGPVVAVTALSATTSAHSMEAEDFVVAGLEFESGAVGSLFASTAAFPGRPDTIRLHSANGTATLRSTELTVEWHDGTTDTFGIDSTTGAGADPMAFSSELHRAVIADFVEAVTTGREPLVTGRTALEVHRVIEAIERSGRSQHREALHDGAPP